MYGFASAQPVQVLGWDSRPETVWVRDQPVELNEVVASPLPPVPLAPTLALHWLAVEGTQVI